MVNKRKAKDREADASSLRQQAAAEFLNSHLHEPGGYWLNFLVNNRRLDRRPSYRVPFEKRGGGVFYKQSDLAAFLEFEKRRRLTGVTFSGRAAEVMQAYGIGSPTGGPFGRKLNYRLLAQENESGPHGQFIIDDPMLVFYLSPAQVDELADSFALLSRNLKGKKRDD